MLTGRLSSILVSSAWLRLPVHFACPVAVEPMLRGRLRAILSSIRAAATSRHFACPVAVEPKLRSRLRAILSSIRAAATPSSPRTSGGPSRMCSPSASGGPPGTIHADATPRSPYVWWPSSKRSVAASEHPRYIRPAATSRSLRMSGGRRANARWPPPNILVTSARLRRLVPSHVWSPSSKCSVAASGHPQFHLRDCDVSFMSQVQ